MVRKDSFVMQQHLDWDSQFDMLIRGGAPEAKTPNDASPSQNNAVVQVQPKQPKQPKPLRATLVFASFIRILESMIGKHIPETEISEILNDNPFGIEWFESRPEGVTIIGDDGKKYLAETDTIDQFFGHLKKIYSVKKFPMLEQSLRKKVRDDHSKISGEKSMDDAVARAYADAHIWAVYVNDNLQDYEATMAFFDLIYKNTRSYYITPTPQIRS